MVTNPPFSLFREYVAQLVEHGKKFLIIGNHNAITYKEIFPLIKDNKLWLGVTITAATASFGSGPLSAEGGWLRDVDENGVKYSRVKGVRWFTNLDHGRRHQKLNLMTMADNLRFSKHKEIRARRLRPVRQLRRDRGAVHRRIPSDYDGVMGVPSPSSTSTTPTSSRFWESATIVRNSMSRLEVD